MPEARLGLRSGRSAEGRRSLSRRSARLQASSVRAADVPVALCDWSSGLRLGRGGTSFLDVSARRTSHAQRCSTLRIDRAGRLSLWKRLRPRTMAARVRRGRPENARAIRFFAAGISTCVTAPAGRASRSSPLVPPNQLSRLADHDRKCGLQGQVALVEVHCEDDDLALTCSGRTLEHRVERVARG